MRYREADDLLFEAYSENAEAFLSKLKSTKYPNTYRAFFSFVVKTGALKGGIFDAAESNNPYALRVLFRSLCEHYLKFTHIMVRHGGERTDAPGKDFYSYCGAAEVVAYGKALKLSESLIGNEFVLKTEAALKEQYPEASVLSAQELELRSAQFTYRNILRNLTKAAPTLISREAPFLASIIPAYAELSSFVHGGPLADSAMVTFGSKAEAMHCEEKAGLAFLIAGSVMFLSSLIVAAEFRELLPHALKQNAIIRKYLGRGKARRAAT